MYCYFVVIPSLSPSRWLSARGSDPSRRKLVSLSMSIPMLLRGKLNTFPFNFSFFFKYGIFSYKKYPKNILGVQPRLQNYSKKKKKSKLFVPKNFLECNYRGCDCFLELRKKYQKKKTNDSIYGRVAQQTLTSKLRHFFKLKCWPNTYSQEACTCLYLSMSLHVLS